MLVTGLMLMPSATYLAGQDGAAYCIFRSVNGLAKQHGGISAGNVFVRVDSICPDAVYISIFGPSGKDPKTTLMPRDGVWRKYSLGEACVSIRAIDGSDKEVLLNVSF